MYVCMFPDRFMITNDEPVEVQCNDVDFIIIIKSEDENLVVLYVQVMKQWYIPYVSLPCYSHGYIRTGAPFY